MKKLLLLLTFLAASSCFADGLEQNMALVPNSTTVVTARTVYVQLIVCSTNGTASTLTITDTAGNAYFNAVSLSANQTTVLFTIGNGGNNIPSGMKMNGIKWSAGMASAVSCQIQGYMP